jgi:hypothetical protein
MTGPNKMKIKYKIIHLGRDKRQGWKRQPYADLAYMHRQAEALARSDRDPALPWCMFAKASAMITKFLYQFYALFPPGFVVNFEWVVLPIPQFTPPREKKSS